MPVSALHHQVAAIALAAASQHGFALGGGNALIAHGIIDRVTQDVDLFTDQEHGVAAAVQAVESALRAAGFRVERAAETEGLSLVFEGMGEGLAEWVITAAGGQQLLLQMAHFDRAGTPVVMEVGPVLDLADVLGGKVCALASRAAPRDYLDVAAALGRFSPAELIGFAKRLDPGLTDEEFADAGKRLDGLPDGWFAELRADSAQIAALRRSFAAWPRTV